VKIDIEGGEIPILDADVDWSHIKKLVFAYHVNYDHNKMNFLMRIDRLRKYFDVYHCKLPESDELKFFPNEILVYCLNKSPNLLF
jgi:hypothetical protein